EVLSGHTGLPRDPRPPMRLASSGVRCIAVLAYAGLLFLPSRAAEGRVIRVSTANTHTLIVDDCGQLWAAGTDSGGSLGNGVLGQNNPAPARVLDLAGVTAAAAGSGLTLALLRDGTVWALGDNWDGGLGNGTDVAYSTVP